MDVLIQSAMEAMRKNGFEVLWAENEEKARELCLEQFPAGKSVGIGGSMTVQALNLIPALKEKGCVVWCHTGAKPEEVKSIRKNAMLADFYLCSPNAITKDGRLVLTDGAGNRLGAVCYGPDELVFVAGINKIVNGGYQAAVGRIKTIAAPLNAKRLSIPSTCLLEGKCAGADCTAGLCCLTLCLERLPGGKKVTVILVNQELGF